MSVPLPVVDMEHKAFLRATFDWTSLWIGGGGRMVSELGRVMVTGTKWSDSPYPFGGKVLSEGCVKDFSLLNQSQLSQIKP